MSRQHFGLKHVESGGWLTPEGLLTRRWEKARIFFSQEQAEHTRDHALDRQLPQTGWAVELLPDPPKPTF